MVEIEDCGAKSVRVQPVPYRPVSTLRARKGPALKLYEYIGADILGGPLRRPRESSYKVRP